MDQHKYASNDAMVHNQTTLTTVGDKEILNSGQVTVSFENSDEVNNYG